MNSYDTSGVSDNIDNLDLFEPADAVSMPIDIVNKKVGTIIKSIDSGASITPDMILKYLLDQGVIIESDLIGLLGEERHHLTVPGLERALARESRIADTSLAKLKGTLTGKGYITSNETKTKILFDRNISKNLGAIGIENEKIMIAMVEDTPDHIAKLSEVLGHSDYEIIFCTVTQLRELQRSCYDNDSVSDLATTNDLLEILDECIRNRGSDVHIAVGLPL